MLVNLRGLRVKGNGVTFHRTCDGVIIILLIHLFICAYLLFSVKVRVDVCQSVGLM